MKKLLSILLLAAMLVTSVAAASCASDDSSSSTTAAATTATPAATTAQPTVTQDPANTTEEEPEPDAETPLIDEEVQQLMDTKTCLNDKIDMESLVSEGATFWNDETEGYAQLFDGIYTDADFTEAGQGKMGGGITSAYFYFDMTEQVKISDYVLVSGNDNSQYPGRNPVAWYIYATNDKTQDLEEWTILDYVYDGSMADADFTPFGYSIDEDKQGEYQYYCWFVEYTGGSLQVCELLLYAD